MNDKDFRYVLALAEYKNFTRAAANLYLSQPALSRYISNLEKELGAALFDRKDSFVQLTKAGATFCRYAAQALELEDKMRHELKRQTSSTQEIIKVGVPLVVGDYFLSRIMTRIAKNPDIQVDPLADAADNLRRRLLSKQLDAAIVCAPVLEPDMCSDLLLRETLYLVGHRSHPTLSGYATEHADVDHPLQVDYSKLKNVPLIHCKPIAFMSYLVEQTLKDSQFEMAEEIKASSLDLALDLSVQGIGFTGVMRSQLKYGNPERIHQLCPLSLNQCKIPFFLAYHRPRYRARPGLACFIQEVLEEYQMNPHI